MVVRKDGNPSPDNRAFDVEYRSVAKVGLSEVFPSISADMEAAGRLASAVNVARWG
jgi:hypothetical protein